MTISQRIATEVVGLGLAAQHYLYQAFTQDYFPGNGTDLKNDRLAAYVVGRCAAVATDVFARAASTFLPKAIAPSTATCTLIGNGVAIALTPDLYSAVAGERSGALSVNSGCSAAAEGIDPLSKEAIRHCPQGHEEDYPNAVPAVTLQIDQAVATAVTSLFPAVWNLWNRSSPQKPILPL